MKTGIKHGEKLGLMLDGHPQTDGRVAGMKPTTNLHLTTGNQNRLER
jgi:hypothetical protein